MFLLSYEFESLDCDPLFHRRSRSNSAQRFITICVESNSPSLSPWFSSLSPATWRVWPHETTHEPGVPLS